MRVRVGLFLFIAMALVLPTIGCQRAGPAGSPGMVRIPAGPFIMGSDQRDAGKRGLSYGIIKPWYEDEHPARTVTLPAYEIDVYEVTNEQYAGFVKATNHRVPPSWTNGRYPAGQERFPVTYVTWDDANGYCGWAGKALPTEAQWEKAARGADGRLYPWGTAFDPDKANVGGLHGGLKPVGSFEAGKSPYGVYDMVGNVSEWTADWYEPYPGYETASDYLNKKFGRTYKVIRGGSWSSLGHYSRTDAMIVMGYYSRASSRFFFDPRGLFDDVGFRCVKPA
ncbi:MAG TPA: formylglycine-generating enzyme family protein [Nitrospiria bacterium]|nr:formylglycine-generating enzyme family protein [Nitrospiria bacterium]